MSRTPYIAIDGKLYRWKDILEIRRAQLVHCQNPAMQLALFDSLHEDCRPMDERRASRRYQQPSLFEIGV